jgi:hypothetical protein
MDNRAEPFAREPGGNALLRKPVSTSQLLKMPNAKRTHLGLEPDTIETIELLSNE